MPIARNIFESIISTVFPPRCLSCRTPIGSYERGELCDRCECSIAPFPHPFYIKKDMLVFAYARYGNIAVKSIIYGLKYKRKQRIGDYVARLMLKKIPRMILPADTMVIPIPLHRKKFRERGFNQSALIARELARHLQFTVYENILFRVKKTKPQSAFLKPADRKLNIANCFAVPRNERRALRGKTVLLVDDIFTSGNTVFEAEKILKKAGASVVHAAVFAKTEL